MSPAPFPRRESASWTGVRAGGPSALRDFAVASFARFKEPLRSSLSRLSFLGDAAWEYVKQYTAVDLKGVLQLIAKENLEKWQKSKL